MSSEVETPLPNLQRFLDSVRNDRLIERWRLNSFMAGIVVKPRARILHGHDWVFSGEVLKVFGKPADGDVISLKDGKDRLIGSRLTKHSKYPMREIQAHTNRSAPGVTRTPDPRIRN